MRFGGLIVAILLAAVAAVIVLMRTASTPQPAMATSEQPIKSVNIYVAAKEISVGTKITEEMIAVQPWPENLVLDGFAKADVGGAAVVGTVARGTFQPQEPILASKLANANDPNFLAGELPKGMRVITIATNETDGLAGFVFPGDRVDVLLTRDVEETATVDEDDAASAPASSKSVPITETLLTNVKVVAIDQRSSSAGSTDKEGNLIIPRSVSLVVSPTDAQRLRLGAKAGTLTLTLRAMADHDASDPLTLTGIEDISQFKAVETAEDGVRVLRGAPNGNKEVIKDFSILRSAPEQNQAGVEK
jgi:pilus assembly protein CpaB